MSPKAREHVYLQLDSESDRAVALLSAAFLDYELEWLLRRFLRKAKTTEELFEPMQPLSSFSARMKLSHSLGLIDQRSYEDLNRIRKIRNVFAHDRRPLSFATPEIASHCSALEWPNILKDTPRQHESPRPRFVSTVQMILGAIAAFQERAHSEKREALGDEPTAGTRTFHHHEVELSTIVVHETNKKTAYLTLSYADASPIEIAWDSAEPVAELVRELSDVEAELRRPND